MSAKERNRRYRTSAKGKATWKRWYKKNRKGVISRVEVWRKGNHKKFLAYRQLEYQKKFRGTPLGYWHSLQGNARRRKLKLMSHEEFLSWYEKERKNCYYCDIAESRIHLLQKIYPWHKFRAKRLEFDRKNNSLGYILGNVVLACEICNIIKSDILDEFDMQRVAQVLINRRIDHAI